MDGDSGVALALKVSTPWLVSLVPVATHLGVIPAQEDRENENWHEIAKSQSNVLRIFNSPCSCDTLSTSVYLEVKFRACGQISTAKATLMLLLWICLPTPKCFHLLTPSQSAVPDSWSRAIVIHRDALISLCRVKTRKTSSKPPMLPNTLHDGFCIHSTMSQNFLGFPGNPRRTAGSVVNMKCCTYME